MTHLIQTLILALALMTALWPVSLVLRDVSIIDSLWAPAFAVLAWAVFFLAGADVRGDFALLLVSLWAVRLGCHVFTRWRHLGHEDYRYAAIRRKFGQHFPLSSLAIVFWFQAVILWVISWPLQAAVEAKSPLNLLDGAGIAMTVAGIVIEAVADAQLTRFRALEDHKERVLNTGLWRYSRHPNYFGDFLIWWGFFISGVAGGAPWWTVLGPIVMSALLIHFSGKGLMEDTITARRPGYRAYIENTSGFFPWPPKA